MPAEKVIFTSYRNSMNIKNLGNIKTELELGLSHIKEALRLAEISTYDISCLSAVSVAKDIIQGSLKMVVTMSSISDDPCFNYFKERNTEGNAGWNPMRSKFPSIPKDDEDNYQRDQDTHQDNVGCKLAAFFQKPNSQTNQMIKDRGSEYTLRSGKRNCQSQCEHYIDGHFHKPIVADEYLPQKMVMRYHARNNDGIYRKMIYKPDERWPKNLSKVENRYPGVGSWTKKDSEIKTRKPNEKRQQVSLRRQEICDIAWRCDMCDITCNGKLQYISHINSKRHKMFLEYGD